MSMGARSSNSTMRNRYVSSPEDDDTTAVTGSISGMGPMLPPTPAGRSWLMVPSGAVGEKSLNELATDGTTE